MNPSLPIATSRPISLRLGDSFWICLIVLTCSGLMLAFPLMGIPDGYDVAQHLRFAGAYHDAILNGTIIPGWAAVDNNGYGSIGIRFYPPLADYLLALTQFVTNDWYTSLWVNSFFWLFPGCLGVYFWTKGFLSRGYAAFAAILYAVMPYHLLQIYQFQLFSEFAASAILPFCFLFATRLIRGGKTSDMLWLAVSVSLLILTHIPSTLIGLMGLGIYCLLFMDWKVAVRTITRLAGSSLIALGATSFYWLRVVTEVDWVRHNTAEYSTGFYDYHRHLFPLIYSFGDWYWQRLLWLLDVPIILTFLFLIPGLACLLWLRKDKPATRPSVKLLSALTWTGLITLFMMSVPSTFIWNLIGPLQKVQFPWRMLAVGSLVAAAVLPITISTILERYPSLTRMAVYTALLLAVSITIFDLTQTILMAAPLPPAKFKEMVVDKRTDEGCTCWWPVWATSAVPSPDVVGDGNRSVNVLEWRPENRRFSVNAGTLGYVRAATFWYPYWKATVNGASVETSADQSGAILIPVPDKSADVSLYFQEPNYLAAARYVSLAVWLGIALVLIGFRDKFRSCFILRNS